MFEVVATLACVATVGVIYLLMKQPRRAPDLCGPGKQTGLHGDVLYGTGLMGDASICLRCGYETYRSIKSRESIRQLTKEDWPALAEARGLPPDWSRR